MRKLLAWFVGAVMLLGMLPTVSAEPGVSAQAAILMDADSGRVLYAKNEHNRQSMASTTKIMTALLALESEQLEQPVTVTREMVDTEGSSMYLQVGDRLTLETLVYGLLLESGNDAAKAIAITVEGSEEAFVARMNERARALGMENTGFETASGLDGEGHFSTAYDMALLTAAALQNPAFVAICSQSSATVDFVEPAVRRTLSNHNRLLREMEGCIGVKSGFTKKSGRCLVSACDRGGIRLIAVTLRAPDDWNDHKAMMDFGYFRLTRVELREDGMDLSLPVVGGVADFVAAAPILSDAVNLTAEETARLKMRLRVPQFLYAPVEEGQLLGRVEYYLDEDCVAEVPIVAKSAVEYKKKEPTFWEKLKNWLFGK